MKTDEARLTQVATDAITFDCHDGPGVTRVYTRQGFENLVEALRALTITAIEEQREEIRETRRSKAGAPLEPPAEPATLEDQVKELQRLRTLYPAPDETLLTAPMRHLAAHFARFGVMTMDDLDPTKDLPPEAVIGEWLTFQRLLAFESLKEVEENITKTFVKLMAEALKRFPDAGQAETIQNSSTMGSDTSP